ncbi:ABC transporter substrate-binding protein [Microbacterium sp. zg-Y818]|uniref:ABC transporter substrate-binding protein n=1 Tax=unclassified Microbacterium TaxID=2609290 RepID=UPI00214D0237|nr:MULTISPECIES: ABC transporter substrate-binding protein [unclassified Microbacterium]MCR2799338.1 ABC transporter substrate-binding protein [Microbacterium sp. zg.Y818]WIM21338.1 ABC transporter substrate-binding protein [Microbacterium sp. zg-Y818]
MKNKRMRLGVMAAAATVFALTLSGCGGVSENSAAPAANATAEIQMGGIAQIAALSEMPGFDPVKLANVGTGVERAAQVMDTLLMRDDLTDEVFPKLASSMTSDDGLVWILELREGVTFTDGEPLDAEAVIFNLERHIAPDSTSTAKALLSGIATMEATGEYEVTITLSAPSGSFPLALTGSSPASLIGSPKALADPAAFNANPVGAGPFVFESWTPDDKLVLNKNPDYWDEGKPYLDGIVYTVMVDPQTRTDDLISGGKHMGLVQGNAWNAVSGLPNLVMIPVPTGGQALVPNGTTGPGSDQRVREAMTMALDPMVTAQVLFGGTEVWDGDVSCVPFAPESPACAPGATNAQDIEKAQELVQEYLAEGGSPDMELVYFQTLTDQATYYQQQFNEIGLNVTVTAVDAATLAQRQAAGDYGVFFGSTASAGFPTVWTRYYSGGTNWGMVTYDDLDAALLRARDELTLEDRNKAWQDVTKIIHDKSILFWTSPYTAAMAHSTKLHLGTPEQPYMGSTMVYLDTAWLEQ